MVEVREATELDVEAIRDLFVNAYGERYSHRSFYDVLGLKKMVYDDDTLLLVAVEDGSDKVLGTASVIFDTGAFGDLVGEFGRLVVHPDGRKRGIGKKLMTARVEAARERLHIGFVENRATHPFSQRISHRSGFTPVGFLPQKFLIEERESLALYARIFGDAAKLRRNNPQVIPEAFLLAQHVLSSFDLEPDAVFDDAAQGYPLAQNLEIEEMTTKGYATLLRFERGRANDKEIFGPARVHQGPFMMKATHSNYILAKEAGQLVGAAGFAVDHEDKAATIFEIVTVGKRPVRKLIEEVLRKCTEEFGVEYVETDVSAYSPRMQKTLLELCFVPVGYIPAFAFSGADRCDAIRMVRLYAAFDPAEPSIFEASKPVYDIVMRNFTARELIPRLDEALPTVELFSGLNKEQVKRVAEICSIRTFTEGEDVITSGQARENAYVILEGELAILGGEGPAERKLGVIVQGDCLGETALVNKTPHYVTARATGNTEAAVINKEELISLIRRRPDIGVALYRNLARGLGRKLRKLNAEVAAK